MRFRGKRERGAVLVEFAISMFVFIFVSFGVIELMRAFLVAQIVGEGARIAAREAATAPGPLMLPPPDDETTIMDNAVFLEEYTAIVLDPDNADLPLTKKPDLSDAASVDDLFRALPPLHSALRSAMFHEFPTAGNGHRNLLRFPGTLLEKTDDPSNPNKLLVRVPIVVSEAALVADVLLKRIVDIKLNGNTIFADVSYDFQFATLFPLDSGGEAKQTLTGVSGFTNTPDGYEAVGSTPDDFGVGQVPGLHGAFVRNLRIPIQMSSAARREIP